MFPLFPPVPPLSTVSVFHPLEGFSHLAPVEPRALSCLIFWARWRTTLRFWRRRNSCYHCEGGDPCLLSRGGGRSAWRANFRELEKDAKRTALFGRGVRKTTPTSSPSSANTLARARARERMPPSSSRVLRQPRESKTHGYRVSRVENPCVSSRNNEDSSERQFWSIATTRSTHRKRRTCHYSGAYLIENLD